MVIGLCKVHSVETELAEQSTHLTTKDWFEMFKLEQDFISLRILKLRFIKHRDPLGKTQLLFSYRHCHILVIADDQYNFPSPLWSNHLRCVQPCIPYVSGSRTNMLIMLSVLGDLVCLMIFYGDSGVTTLPRRHITMSKDTTLWTKELRRL